jgi:hypothetical protein
MVILCTHLSGAAAFGSLQPAACRPSATSNEPGRVNIVAQLIHRFCADDHSCYQWLREAYNRIRRPGASRQQGFSNYTILDVNLR